MLDYILTEVYNYGRYINERGVICMKVKDLLTVLKTDNIVVIKGMEILVDCETSYIEQALYDYLDDEIENIVPLDNRMEINLREDF